MSLLSNYNKDIKIIYSGSFENFQGKEFLLNGLLPEVNRYVLNELKADSKKTYSDVIEQLKKHNQNNAWTAFVSHKNFYNYNKRFNGIKNLVTTEGIVNDGTVYIYPVEICFTLDSILDKFNISVQGKSYDYGFIDTIDKNVLIGLRLGYIKLLLNYIHDPIETEINLDRLEKFFSNYDIPLSNIIVVSGNSLDEYQEKNPGDKIKITQGYIVLDQLADKFTEYPSVGSLGYKSEYMTPADLDKSYIRSKKFICLNRNMHRPHRWLSAYLAAKYNLFDDSIFTFVAIHNADKNKIKSDIESLVGTVDNIDNIVNTISNNIPKEIDTMHLPVNEKNGFHLNNNNKKFYAESYINVVNETIYNRGGGVYPFITEKTFHHPIINLQPFIVIGNPFVLKTLGDLGFKTFHPIIDESYDSCIDHVQRFELIEREISRLANLSIKEIHDIYYQLADILIYNQTHAKTFSDYNPFEQTFNSIRNWYLK